MIPLCLGYRYPIYNIETIIKSDNGYTYDVEEQVGSGGNAIVHKCIDRITGEEYAVKFLLALSAKMQRRFQQEIKLLQETKHDHLIKYIGNGTQPATQDQGQRSRNLQIPFLIMPLATSNLLKFINARGSGNIQFEEYMPQFKGLALALAKLHEKALHRDIKPENILIIGDTWVLSDLGLCKYITSADGETDISRYNEHIGPKYWMSPESINQIYGNADEISIRSDIYQLCSVFWFVVTGRHPSGILTEEDWTGPRSILSPIFSSLSHNVENRIPDGNSLYNALYEATLQPDKECLSKAI